MKKGILAALALSLALPACALGEAGYTAGTYSAEAQGMESAVKVTVTVSDSAITDLTIDVSGETAGLGTEVGEPLKAAILEAQSADVDGVSGATVCCRSSTAASTSSHCPPPCATLATTFLMSSGSDPPESRSASSARFLTWRSTRTFTCAMLLTAPTSIPLPSIASPASNTI